ncbi:MAG: HEAT repeat-containing protein [Candidatus Kentron sp. G]|nr:MAG: HEAT repeat-containing protein [Candidatus Kentron sp. G]VFN01800.1 MAG: HEAT repeat-containing protein [Candidatus Kentron sp. G]VFN03338.1 MAG: HEAT repeat-containing protein [Candidatus Kentron sp. G]
MLSAAANTTLARKLIPGLLRHDAPQWRRVAVSVLRDMDSDESLDDLVRLLRPGSDSFVRAEAAKALVELLKERGEELSKKAVLLPERTDPKADRKIWPFERRFPGRLALPMAEAVVNGETRNEAIRYAARAMRIEDSQYPEGRRFLKQWRNLPRDMGLNRGINRLGKALTATGMFLLTSFLVLFLGAQIYGMANSAAALEVEFSPVPGTGCG